MVINVPACYNSPTRNYTGAYEIKVKEKELEIGSLIVSDDEVSVFSTIYHPLIPKKLVKKI